jgi:5-formaminoimidazole-4-carboxamide-1-(beta)-D-ribofuranosyl 5'-monophosphate synthetase
MVTDGYKIGTIGSHSALQILKGAKDEGFKTVAICLKGRAYPYKSFKVADEIIEVDNYSQLKELEARLLKEKVIMIPHGSFFQGFSAEALKQFQAMYFGNKHILPWEESREKQREWLRRAGLTLPRIYKTAAEIDGPAIIKFYGAGGGKGYFLAHTPGEFKRKIDGHANRRYIIQEYVEHRFMSIISIRH